MRILFLKRALLLTLGMLALSAASFAQIAVGVSVSFAPPELPVYEQPLCPGDGYIWTPGYWAWDGDDYFWVPGTWVLAPEVGFFWTPGYWAWGGSGFFFHEGYWGPVVGFYGGINYGFGYFGHGYEGGRWEGGRFYYNRSVNNLNITEVHNVYNTRVASDTARTRVSFNGGHGGVNERPTPQEEAAAQQRHIPPVSAQHQHLQAARTDQSLRASANHGKPRIAATPKPGSFGDRGIVAAKEGGRYSPPARPEGNSGHTGTAVHPSELPSAVHPEPNTGNTKLDLKYRQKQQKLQAQQDQERQKLQRKQDQEHQRLAQKNADDARKQQVEQKHQRQTEQLSQKHAQQQQKLQTRQNPPRQSAPRSAPKGKP